jgi:hypothetical protein
MAWDGADMWERGEMRDSRFTRMGSNREKQLRARGESMKNWKRAVVFGSLGAGALLLITGKRPAGVAAATVGLAILASEYPDSFERVWEHAPDYVTRGIQIFQTLSQIAERFAEQASQRGIEGAWSEMRQQHYGR